MAQKQTGRGTYVINGQEVNARSQGAAERQLAAANAKLKQNKQGGVSSGNKKDSTIISKDRNLNTVEGLIGAGKDVSTTEAKDTISFNNPNITNDFGSLTYTQNADGTVNVNQNLSQQQQDILNKGSKLTVGGLDAATSRLVAGGYDQEYKPDVIGRISTADQLAKRDQVEKAVYDRLTRFNAGDKKRESEEMQQQLYNQGIQYNPDQNSRYQNQTGDLNRRFDQLNADAINAAVQFGGQEQERQVGMNEQVIANQFSQGMQTRNQGLNEISQLQGLGTGLQVPNFPGYQGPGQIDYGDAGAIQGSLKGQKQNQQALDQANRRLGASGGGTQQAALPPPINMIG